MVMAAPPLPITRDEVLDLKRFFEEFQDYLAPRLDVYSQAIYLYLFRLSRLVGKDTVLVGLGTARRRMAFGVGEHGRIMCQESCTKRIRELSARGCIQVLQVTRKGSYVRVFLPSEIPGVVPSPAAAVPE